MSGHHPEIIQITFLCSTAMIMRLKSLLKLFSHKFEEKSLQDVERENYIKIPLFPSKLRHIASSSLHRILEKRQRKGRFMSCCCHCNLLHFFPPPRIERWKFSQFFFQVTILTRYRDCSSCMEQLTMEIDATSS